MTKKRYTSRRKFKPCPVPRPDKKPGTLEYEYPHKLHGRSRRVTRSRHVTCSRYATAGHAWVWVCVGYALAGLGVVAWCLWYMMRR